MLKTLKGLLLYGGLDKTTYKGLKNDISESNRQNVLVFSVILIIAFFVMTGMALFDMVDTRRDLPVYGGLLAAFCAAYVINRKWKNEWVTLCSVYLFMLALMAVGIYMGAVSGINERTTLYLVCQLSLSVLFCVRPLVLMAVLGISQCVYVWLICARQSVDLLSTNLLNTTAVMLVAIVMGTYLLYIKVSRFASERMNKYLLETDNLTGILNRRSYEAALGWLRAGSDDEYTVLAFDVNGLKTVNDTLGHAAGDELIKGAALCINEVFGNEGECFRTGGDEFMAIMRGKDIDTDALTAEFREKTRAWKGNMVKELSVSMGLVRSRECVGMTVDEIVSGADRRMYEDKAVYYSQPGHERRRT